MEGEEEESNSGPFNLGAAKQHSFNDFHVLMMNNYWVFKINESLNS